MRSDAANLLARLGRRDFRYREFTDNFADMELWPIFEALLTDDRVVGKPVSALAARSVEDVLPTVKAAPAKPAVSQSDAGIFGGYSSSRQNTSSDETKNDLRSFFQRISDNDEGGRA
ncbi:hypothetical protein TomTYG75_06530 [Sphingobium sp. TomTYG75]